MRIFDVRLAQMKTFCLQSGSLWFIENRGAASFVNAVSRRLGAKILSAIETISRVPVAASTKA